MSDANPTTVAAIRNLFEAIVTDSLDHDLFIQLLNQADMQLRMEREWEILKKIDSSQSAASGDTYLTMKNLPSDFERLMALEPLLLGSEQVLPIPFLMRERYKDQAGWFYVNHAGGQFALTGSHSAGTIYLPYLYKPDYLEGDADEPIWPEHFRAILAYDVANLFQGNIDDDVDGVAFRMSDSQKRTRASILRSMEQWDTNLKMASMGGSGGFAADKYGNRM